MKKSMWLMLFLICCWSAGIFAQEIDEQAEVERLIDADDFDIPFAAKKYASSQSDKSLDENFNLAEDPNLETEDKKDETVSEEPLIVCSPKFDAASFKNRCDFYNNYPNAADLCSAEHDVDLKIPNQDTEGAAAAQ